MIWCVEDDESIRELELYTLRSTGFEAEGFDSGTAFLSALTSRVPELILLDIMLPGQDGVTLLKQLRSSTKTAHIPVIMATAKGSEIDKVQSLDLGADDYLVKPFGMMEMVSRVKAVLRRCTPTQQPVLSRDGLTLNPDERTVTLDGSRINLTYKEYELLHLFLTSPGTVFTRDRLFTEVWGMDHLAESRTVDMHIRTLRQKLEPWGERIQTVRGVGYRLEAMV